MILFFILFLDIVMRVFSFFIMSLLVLLGWCSSQQTLLLENNSLSGYALQIGEPCEFWRKGNMNIVDTWFLGKILFKAKLDCSLSYSGKDTKRYKIPDYTFDWYEYGVQIEKNSEAISNWFSWDGYISWDRILWKELTFATLDESWGIITMAYANWP